MRTLLILLLAGCAAAAEDHRLQVFAAASLSDVLDAAIAAWKAEGGADAIANYGATSQLARQIAAGAHADLFVAADARWVDDLAKDGHVVPASRRALCGNALVVIGARGTTFSVRFDRSADPLAMFPDRIALADPAHVPAGVYAKESFTALGWWDELTLRVIPTEDVRAALRLVQAGEVDAGLVYASDARSVGDAVRLVATVPEELHRPIVYELASTSDAAPAAADLAAFLVSPACAAAFTDRGFTRPAHGR